MLEKEVAKGQKGEGLGKGRGWRRQEEEPDFGNGTERASGSTDNANGPGREARQPRREAGHIMASERATEHPEE
eukprot:3130027-Heterocapsa_arctica.AAC.1